MIVSLIFLFLQKAGEFATSSGGREYTPPDGPLFYITLIGASIIVLAVVIYTIKWFIWPGETSPDHIKRRILKPEIKESSNHE
jgi:hypothetical protein